MDNNKLLVRVYNVGCGDCIFVRVPDVDRPYHILIDCGNFFSESADRLKSAMNDVVRLLTEGVPDEQAGQLDLLVATHKHWDHIKGFELDVFKRLKIQRIWLTVAMDESHEHAVNLRAFEAQLGLTLQSLEARGLALSARLLAVLMNSLSTADAARALREELPADNEIKPLYVYRGFEEDLSAEDRDRYLLRFRDPSIRLRVLAPEKDIDGTYLSQAHSLMLAFSEHSHLASPGGSGNGEARCPEPVNISKSDFRRLCSRLMYTSLALAGLSNHIINNTSVVLLLEWRGRRLLFPGDAEWDFEGAGENGSWEVMWATEGVREALSQPLDFLKVGHHGSVNATPWDLGNAENSVNRILDALLPEPQGGEDPTARAVVSTRVEKIKYDQRLMQELGRRVKNACEYAGEPGLQPRRTDREDEPWIPAELDPAPD